MDNLKKYVVKWFSRKSLTVSIIKYWTFFLNSLHIFEVRSGFKSLNLRIRIYVAINYGSTGSGSTTLVLFTHRKRYFHYRMSYLICKVFVFVFAVWLYCRVLGPVFTYGSLDFEDKYRIEMIKMEMKMFQKRMRIL